MKYDLICAGTALVDSIIREFDPVPVSASGYRAASGCLMCGGEAVNESIAAAKLGLRTGILCALGKDAAGNLIRNELQESGVDTKWIVKAPQTPVSTLFVQKDGSRKSITNNAHRYNFHPEKYENVFTDARVLLLGSLFRAPFDDPEIIFSVLHAARKAGQMIFADTKVPNFRALALNDLSDALPLIDFITPNEDEARYLTGQEEPEKMADTFLKKGVRNVIIKLGSRGCFLKNNRETCLMPGYRIHAVDTTGAGDHFIVGFISEILRGRTIQDALQFANACGAICSTAVGAETALQSREQVIQWMAEPQSEIRIV